MCAASKNNHIEDAAEEHQWTRRLARFAGPAMKYVGEIVMAPVELVQRVFYRPNSRQDEFVIEDLNAKFKQNLNENYIVSCSQKLKSKPVEVKLDPRKTYDNLDICQSGTFKTIGALTQQEEELPQLQLIDEIEEQALSNVVYMPSPSLSDSQILRARPTMTDSQVMRARASLSDSQVMRARRSLVVRPLMGELAGADFTGVDSGTYGTMPNVTQIQAKVISSAKCSFTQSGVYQLVEPDINPHGLQQFIETKEEKSA